MKIISNVGEPNVSQIYYKLAQKLSPRHQTTFVTISGKIEQEFSRQFPVINVERLVNERIAGKKPLPEHYGSVRNNYSAKQLQAIYSMDYALLGTTVDALEEKTRVYIATWLELLKQARPDLIATLDASTLFDTTAFEAAKKTGTPMLFTNGIGPVSGTIFWDTTNMLNTWVDKNALRRAPTEVERKRIEQYIAQMRERKPVHGGSRQRIVSFENAVKYASFVLNYLVKERGAYHNPLSLAKERILQLSRPRMARKYYSRKQVHELLAGKFVFFALQTPDDGQIVARAQKFAPQHQWAIKCSRCLPAGVKLLVKEHPHAIGSYPMEWLREMAAEPKIEIVRPSVSSHDLIRNSLATIVINSTVGWEALLYQKPVVVLSNPFYSGMGLTFDAKEDEQKIPLAIARALASTGLDKEKVYRLVNAVFNSLDNCCFYKFENGKRSFDLGEANIAKLAGSLEKAYKKHFGNTETKSTKA